MSRLLLAGLVALYGVALLGVRLVPWHDALLLPVVLVLAVHLVAREERRFRFAALALVAFAVLVLHVLLVWKSGYAGRNHLFAGVFPLSDAGDYYADAMRVAHGTRMSGSGSRRPLSVALFAAVLRATASTRATLLVFTALWAFAAALTTNEILRTHGKRAAQIAFVLVVLFARRYAGLVQSEGLGGPAGCIAFAFLWRAASTVDGSTRRVALDREAAFEFAFATGFAWLTLALFARPGPFLALPALFAWGALVTSPAQRSRTLVRAGLAFVAALVVAKVVARGTASTAAFSDYPAIVYGLLTGEEHTFIVAKHPFLDTLAPNARASAMWTIVIDYLRLHPAASVAALFTCLASYVYLPQGFFGFVWQNPDDRVLENGALVKRIMGEEGPLGLVRHWVRELGAVSLVNAVVMGALGAAFVVALGVAAVRLVRGRKVSADPHGRLLRFAGLGIAASMPLLPPWVTEGVQMHATVFSFFVALVATHVRAPGTVSVDAGDGSISPWSVRGAWFALATIAVAPFGCFFGNPGIEENCAGDDNLVIVDWSTRVRFGARGDQSRADTRTNLELLAKRNPAFAERVARAAAEGKTATMVAGYEVCTERPSYLIDDRDLLPSTRASFVPMHTEPLTPAPLARVERVP